MSLFEDGEIPIQRLRDGREFISAIDCVEYPHVAEFVKRFSNYWTAAPDGDGYVGPMPDEREAMIKQQEKKHGRA